MQGSLHLYAFTTEWVSKFNPMNLLLKLDIMKVEIVQNSKFIYY